ncbi:SMP-30/gluconolactonase/LRE family protein [Nocardioides ungokensis]|uniref:PQQ-binding-like beta-propeller repeat protein n=1 Tax=Nocardioides ungokensis TaxID=1643322 RepID=UPI0015DE0534|nr:PQQ-binding-like beta-propeller repeat protein [Nocardioides ungokensis]
MRFQRSLTLLGVGLLWLALGPWVLPAALATLLVPRVRAWMRPTWRAVAAVAAAVLALAGLVWLVPDGWLPIPPGPGALVTPGYVGRPAAVRPIRMEVPQQPHLAANGTGSVHDDAWATDTYPWSGPLGESPGVDTSWFGLEECAGLAVDSHDRLVGLCGDLHGRSLHVIDPDSMNPVATKELPGSGDTGTGSSEDLCAGGYFFLDDRDRAVVATTDRRVLVVATSDADGDPDLTTEASYDLTSQVPDHDCLVALMPDRDGRIWWTTQQGRVGTIDQSSGRVRVLDLGEEIANSFAVDGNDAYVVTTHALYRLDVGPSGRPAVTWRTAYDRGSEQKSGQLSRGSGTTPTLLPGGLVAITDNADPRMDVVFYRTDSGDEVCRSAVFGDDESATESSLVSVGTGVIVENNHGYGGPLSTAFGMTADGGLARVDVADGDCSVRWTSDEVAPSSVPKLSRANGLLYTYTKPHSWWGANAWYLTAIDARTGRSVFKVRTGLGALMNNHHSAVTLTRDGSAYVGTVGGLVRVRDRSTQG